MAWWEPVSDWPISIFLCDHVFPSQSSFYLNSLWSLRCIFFFSSIIPQFVRNAQNQQIWRCGVFTGQEGVDKCYETVTSASEMELSRCMKCKLKYSNTVSMHLYNLFFLKCTLWGLEPPFFSVLHLSVCLHIHSCLQAELAHRHMTTSTEPGQ